MKEEKQESNTKEKSERKIPWRNITIYAILAYGISWLYWLTAIIPHWHELRTDPSSIVSSHPYFHLFGTAIPMFGPMIAALIMRLFISKEGLKKTVKFRCRWWYYLIAFLAPPVFYGILIFFNDAVGLGHFFWSGDQSFLLSYVFAMAYVVLVLPFAFGEEYGWRGYLLPKVLPLGEKKAALVVGLIWTFWHLPVMVIGESYPGQNVALIIGVFTVMVVLLSFIFTRLYIAAMSSVIITTIFHASIDIYSDMFTSPATIPGGNPLVTSGGGVVALAFMLVIVVLLYKFRKRDINVNNQNV